MLRALVALLLLANLAVWGWSRNAFAPWLEGPGQGQREPARMAQQVRPEALRVLAPQAASAALGQAVQAQALQEAAAASAGASAATLAGDAASAASAALPAASAPPAPPAAPASAVTAPAASTASTVAAGPAAACLETATLAASELARAEQALRSARPGLRWATLRQERGGVFIVYMGRYPDPAQMQKKQDELRRLGVAFQPMSDSPTLVPGLQLGRYDSRGAANAALADFSRRGVNSARVAMLVAPVPVGVLRLDKPAPDLLEPLQALDLGGGVRFRPCAATPART